MPKSKSIFDRNFYDMLSSEVISVSGGLVAGLLLALYSDKLLFVPGMLLLLPGFLEMRGNISGTLASRLSSGLFLGVIKPKIKNTKIIRGNLFASFALALFASFMLGLLAFLFNYFVLKVFVLKIIFLPVIAGLLANAVEISIVLFATFFLFRRGHDPNNIMGPLITTTGDLTSIASLLVVFVLI